VTVETITIANVKQAVPFSGVTNMESSLRFYVDGLGFKIKHRWVPDVADGNPEGKIRWCWLQHGDAGIMLQSSSREVGRRKRLGPEPQCASCVKTH
jgi:catechol 2,3-dioxygenase-like lactoylglutathione lyase family enzyme